MPTRRWVPIVLFSATLLCYSRLFWADFLLLDDSFTVQHNVDLLPPSAAGALHYWRPFNADRSIHDAFGLYMPLTYTFWSVVATVAQTKSFDSTGRAVIELNPYIFHIANILLHATSGILVYVILRRLLKSDWPAVVGAMVFLFHPVQVESVAWISGAKDLLAGLLGLVAVWRYLAFRSATSGGWRRLHFFMAIVATLAAMFAKPSAITIPLILLVIDVLILNQALRKSLIVLAPSILVAMCFAVIAAKAQPARDVPAAPIWARFFVVGDALGFYLYKLILPLRLGVEYGRRPAAVMPHAWFYFVWILPVIVAILVWKLRKRSPLFFAGLVIFFVAAAPTLGFTTFLFQRFSTTADHYLYLPMLGAAVVVAAAIESAPRMKARIAAILICLTLAILTIVQTGYWLNDRALFLHALIVNPRSFMAQTNLASDALGRGDLAEAEYRLKAMRTAEPMQQFYVQMFEVQVARLKSATKPVQQP